MVNCPFCQKPIREDGSIVHHSNCSGLDLAEINNLQHDMLNDRISKLEAALRKAIQCNTSAEWRAWVLEQHSTLETEGK